MQKKNKKLFHYKKFGIFITSYKLNNSVWKLIENFKFQEIIFLFNSDNCVARHFIFYFILFCFLANIFFFGQNKLEFARIP